MCLEQEIKAGDIVSVRDISWSLVVNKDGSLKTYYALFDAWKNQTLRFKVIATNLKGLASEPSYFHPSLDKENDTIMQDIKSGEIIFIKKEFLRLDTELDSDKQKTKKIKAGDIVKVTNASGNYYVASDGSLKHDYHLGATKNRRVFIVVATGLKNLPKSQCRGWYDRNDTIIVERDNQNTYFTKMKYLEPIKVVYCYEVERA